MLKIDKKSYRNIAIYNIGYITIKKIDDRENINRVNTLYLRLTHAGGYIEEINGNKYFIFDSTDGNKKYNDVFNGIRDQNQNNKCGKENDY